MNAAQMRELQAAFGKLTTEQRALSNTLTQFTDAQAEVVAPLAKLLTDIRDSLATIAKAVAP